MATNTEKKPMVFFDDKDGHEQVYVIMDEMPNLGVAALHFLEQWNKDHPEYPLEFNKIRVRWGYMFEAPIPEAKPVVEVHYWPTDHNAGWDRLDQLLKACQRVLPARWGLSEDRSGSWYWWRKSGLQMQAYATPEWEGDPGIAFLQLDDDDIYKDDEQITLEVELTGDHEIDALRIVLKVINQFERGY